MASRRLNFYMLFEVAQTIKVDANASGDWAAAGFSDSGIG
jgi:hypothetical protein